MFQATRRAGLDAAKIAALDRSLASIIFSPDGIILDANGNFLSLVGYGLDEVRGRHHRMFVHPDEAGAPAYEAFWQSLRQGVFQAAQYRRFGKGGQEVWIQATYNPVLDRRGRVVQIVKFATDVTAEKFQAADAGGQISAINRSQAVIHFALDGTILDANEAFLAAVGYDIGEVRGQHHRLFVTPEERDSEDYAEFWRSLRVGSYRSGEFRRIRKSGDELWLQASYNPIFDMNGRPFKIVKYAADVTVEKLRAADMSGQVDAIGRSQAVVHFAMDGTISDANDNFLEAMGYSFAEVKGRHHRMFVPEDYAASADYENFWFKLRQGEFASGLYQRLGKDGREVWIQGNYNPVLDLSGRPFKVVKYASDITKSMSIRSRAVKAAEETLYSMTTVTKAAENMKVSADQITGHMRQSSAAVGEIQSRTMAADRSTGSLRNAALAMDGVVQVITSIAERINLLALNATIEAARAGPAGRGFAVVASEVKDLAAQATTATTQISAQINAMQSVSGDVETALASIVTSVDAVKNFVAQAAQSVDRQAQATGEISTNMQTAAAGVAGITRSLDDWVVGLDRRRDRRDRVSQRAKITTAAGERPSDGIDCVILNISVGGAKLKTDEVRVPDRFLLTIEGEEAQRSCYVRRRGEGELGVMFV